MVPPILTRRSFLLATAGVALAGAACGGDDGGGSAATTTAPVDRQQPERTLLQYFNRNAVLAGEQRLPYGIGDAEGVPMLEAPEELSARILRDGAAVAEVTARRYGSGLPRPYFPFRTELSEPGLYELAVDLDGATVTSPFSIVETAPLVPPGPGDAMVPVDTPTLDDARGVNPICTREETCPLHEVPLSAALEEDRPTVLIVATPAFCQTVVCGPVLDIVLSHRERIGDRARMIHAEVYVNPEESLQETTDAVKAYRLPYEPVLFVARADGTIASRLDYIFDEVEVGEALDELLAS
jgi:hypothetical protein